MKSIALVLAAAALALGGCTIRLSENVQSDYRAVQAGEQRLQYRVYLPPQYEAQPNREFPLLVYFHGGGGDQRTWGQKGGLAERLAPVMMNEEFGPFIVLAPSVGRFDVITGEAERALFDQVLPKVRAEYRVNDVTLGFGHSMGGLSVLMLGLRNPGVFDAVAVASPFAYDVSPFDEQAEIERFEQQYGSSFFVNRWQKGIAGKFETRESFDSYSPFEQVRHLERRPEFRLFLTTGTEDQMGLYPQNELLHDELNRAGIEHEYLVQQGVAHSTLADPRLYQWINQQADSLQRTGGGK